jgi:flagellar hook assembly protein FlgD
VFDLSGRLVKQIAANVQGSGAHAFTWDGTDMAGARVRTGVYFVRGRIGQQSVRAQVLMLR